MTLEGGWRGGRGAGGSYRAEVGGEGGEEGGLNGERAGGLLFETQRRRLSVCVIALPPLHATRHLLLLTSEVGLRLRDPDFAPLVLFLLLLSSRFVLRKCRPPSLFLSFFPSLT